MIDQKVIQTSDFKSQTSDSDREARKRRWQDALARSLNWAS
jgi:hypothetical protein